MAASNAFSGVGTVFKRDGVALAEVTGIAGFNKSRDIIDKTTLDSTGGYREKLGGFRDGGQIVLSMNFDRDVFTLLNVDFEASTNQSFTIVLSDTGNTEFAFSGWVINLTMDVPLDDKVTMNCTIDIDGVITMTS
jgi:predicted secreted protein